ncbi:MAG: SWIM zinc finger family protein [Candidatus Thermoplasmatota archaeon]|nr:SWIM zinc finger family protein [Candidatus Thermoplasmatota archaeon]
MRLTDEYPSQIIERGERYTHNVNYCIKLGDFLYAEVEGTTTYRTKVQLSTLQGDCTCPYQQNCKHAVAAILTYRQGQSIDADPFINHLNTLDKQQLINLILTTVQNNPDLILEYQLKTSTNCDVFVEELLEDCSYKNMKKAMILAPQFTFDHIMDILDFLKNHDEDILVDYYESYYDDEIDPLYDFKDALMQELLNKTTSEQQMKQILTMDYAHDGIIENAEKFIQYVPLIKPIFSKEQYLEFLLNQQNPNLEEVEETLTEENKHLLYSLPTHNLGLAKKIAQYLSDELLFLTVAIYKEDYKDIIRRKESLPLLLAHKDFFIERKLPSLVDLFRKHTFSDESIARLLLSIEDLEPYDEKQLTYLVNQITDTDFLQQRIDPQQRFSKNKPLFEHLFQLNDELGAFLLENLDLITRDTPRTELTEILSFIKKQFGNDYVRNLITRHESIFKTSSSLKSQLKKLGIMISYRKGMFSVEVH